MTIIPESKNSKILVFDVGGTSLRGALYCAKTDRLLSLKRANTQNHKTLPHASGSEIRKRLFEEISHIGLTILQGSQPDIVSFAFPGPVDPCGNALAAPTIWSDRCTEPVNVKESLRKIWPSVRILILNDVTAAGYRYIKNPNEDLCIITVSSGIGHKIFVNGRAVIGPNGRGGEIGHVRVDSSPDAPICECGDRGHLAALVCGRASSFQVRRLFAEDPEAFASSALGREMGKDPDRIDNKSIVELYHKEDPWTVEIVRRMAQPLGQMLATLHLAVGMERFVIIGGFALALGERYRQELVKAASACAWKLAGDWDSMVELGSADDNAGLIGAGRYAAFYTDLEKP